MSDVNEKIYLAALTGILASGRWDADNPHGQDCAVDCARDFVRKSYRKDTDTRPDFTGSKT